MASICEHDSRTSELGQFGGLGIGAGPAKDDIYPYALLGMVPILLCRLMPYSGLLKEKREDTLVRRGLSERLVGDCGACPEGLSGTLGRRSRQGAGAIFQNEGAWTLCFLESHSDAVLDLSCSSLTPSSPRRRVIVLANDWKAAGAPGWADGVGVGLAWHARGNPERQRAG